MLVVQDSEAVVLNVVGGGGYLATSTILPDEYSTMRLSPNDTMSRVSALIGSSGEKADAVDKLVGDGFTEAEAGRIVGAWQEHGAMTDGRRNVLRDIAYQHGFWMRGGKMPERVADAIAERRIKKHGVLHGDAADWMRSGGIDPSKYDARYSRAPTSRMLLDDKPIEAHHISTVTETPRGVTIEFTYPLYKPMELTGAEAAKVADWWQKVQPKVIS